MTLAGKIVLVTGGGGFIGTHLCRRLAREGAMVTALARHEATHLNGIATTVQVDAASFEAVHRTLAELDPDVVVHLASAVTGKREISQIRPTFESNLTSTVNVLTAATELGIGRIVLTGSMEEPSTRDLGSVAPSPYAAAKQASTIYADLFHGLYSAPVVVLRLFMVYGPEQWDRTKLIPYVGRCFLSNEAPHLASGTRAVDWIYVDDVVEAYMRAIEEPSAVGTKVDIGSGTHVTIREVVERLAQITRSKVEPIFDPARDRPLETARLANVEDAHRVLGWRPTVTLDDGLRRTVDWLRNEAGS